ncbi:hypothetical protein COW80_02020, partial [Candidatus Beckwithbacteria bacterium CG22_combo_CG10-13_8_21_14_all_01_47_9]
PTTFLLDKDGRPIGIQRFVEGNTYYLNNTPQADLAVRTLKEKGVGITDPKGNIVHSANGPIIIDQEGIFLIDESKLVIAQHPEIAPYYTQWFSLDEAKEFAKKAGVPLVAAAPTGNWFDNNVYNTQNGLFPKWTTWKKPILITAGVGAAAWIGDQLDIFDP